MITIYDIAKRAKVSAATVSRTLNNRATVDPKLAKAVHEAARELGYHPNAVGRNLRRQQTSLWAVLVSDITNPFFTAMVRGIEDIAQEAGYSVVLCNSDEDETKEGEYVSVIMAERMAGVIMAPASEQATHVHKLVAAGITVVTVDREVKHRDVSSVLVDNRRGARDAVAHLAESGYSRIACITGPSHTFTALERLEGYRVAVKECGLRYDRSLVRLSDFREHGGYRSMESLLESTSPPDSVFVANNQMSLGALRCLADHNVKIPDEFGIVGFDDTPWAELVRPRLSTVAQPTTDLGRTAAELLVRRLSADSTVPNQVILPTQLVIRESSKRPITRSQKA